MNITLVEQETMKFDEMSNHEHLMSIYGESEFVPSAIIEPILNHHMPSSKIVLRHEDSNDFVMIVKVNELLNAKIKNWHCNRPPDKIRCNEIARWFHNNNAKINTAFYMFYDNLKRRFEIFDGIHRLTALKKMKEDMEWGGEFGTTYSKMEHQYVTVFMYFNTTEGQVIDLFKSLNKSISVPELYLKDQKEEKRRIIEGICKEWSKKYKKNFSASANPISGNINRDTFIDILDKLYDKYEIDETNANVLKEKLDVANTKISFDFLNSKTTSKERDAYLRCKSSGLGCYLFLYKKDILLEMI